jgi:hypothetical protein
MVDATTILERQEKAVYKLKNLKHEHGSLQYGYNGLMMQLKNVKPWAL